MPVAEGGTGQGRQALLVLLGASVGVVAVMFLILRQGDLVGDTGGTELLGVGSVATVGSTEDLAQSVEDTGPIFFPDVASRDRDIFVNHLGEEIDEGWVAFAARPLDATRDCTLVWQIDDEIFVDPCDGEEFPADGSGLQHYPVTVDQNGNLSIDLNALDRATTTTEG